MVYGLVRTTSSAIFQSIAPQRAVGLSRTRFSPQSRCGDGSWRKLPFACLFIALLSITTSTLADDRPAVRLEIAEESLDFGSWDAERTGTTRCISIHMGASDHAREVDLTAVFGNLPVGFGGSVSPRVPPDGVVEVCISAPRCCSSARLDGVSSFEIRAQQPMAGDGTVIRPMRGDVRGMSLWTCWKPIILATLLGSVTLFVLIGFAAPRSFQSNVLIALSGTESGIGTAPGRQLRAQPGGRRGWYRHAKVSFDAQGNAVRREKGAALIILAGRNNLLVVKSGPPIERRNDRTRKWEPISQESGETVLIAHKPHRVGTMYFKLFY